ncbi:MAG: integral rane sensor hybrid histidine kinase, partial [Polaromonas sp.]|nr:integral rane sensor hybrid histidine kinase [Polaromonas sp.]
FATMMGQAINIARTARTSIDLRFENIELMDQLRHKTDIAEAARHEAEEANAAKSKFLAAASHDLRQPIHAQGLFLEVLGQTPLTAHQREVLGCARSASLASSEMLNTLLDFSRIDAGVVKPHIQPFALQTLFHKIENDLAPLADAKGMVYRSRETQVAIDSDAALVEMILRNLVSNAIRYTERGGVLITCRKRRHLALVEVWDTGIGIAPENQQEIFREFHQLGNPERDRRKGLGLGLAIAEGVAKALGRDLSLSSRLGRGSVFWLALPLSHAVVMPTELAWKPDPAHLQGMHVLVVDDDETVLLGMAQLLQGWGCRCDTAGSIGEALDLARLHVPDVVISDYRLREQRTGAQAIAALRELLGKQLSALMITGDTAPERLREALASGVPLLHKPVAPDQLYRALGDLMRSVAAG